VTTEKTDRNSSRVLVVANAAIGTDELREQLLRHFESSSPRVFVVSPALTDSRAKHFLGDVDKAIDDARGRLERSLRSLREAGLEAAGEVGDADPIVAIADEIEKFHPDEIVVVAHADEQAAYAEQGLLERAERDFEQPLTELIIEEQGERVSVVGVEETHPEAEGRRTFNLPRFSGRDIAGILVAVIGTGVLVVLAADCMVGDADTTHEEGLTSAPCVARLLLAGAAGLVNLAHVVGLFLFESVRYRGVFERLFARISLFGTPLAVAISLLLGLAM
jgi:hypothetical protein